MALLERSSQVTQRECIKKGVGVMCPVRSADSVCNCFKGQIAPEVMRYVDIEETTNMGSGWSPGNHKAACLETFKPRYGHTFDVYLVYLYLKDNHKFSCYQLNLRRNSMETVLWERKRLVRQKVEPNFINPLSLKLLQNRSTRTTQNLVVTAHLWVQQVLVISEE